MICEPKLIKTHFFRWDLNYSDTNNCFEYTVDKLFNYKTVGFWHWKLYEHF